MLWRLLRFAWNNSLVASSWQHAWVRLLAKTDDTSHPSKMRPISILNVEGRIFFSVLQKRLSRYLLQNNYVSRSVQKGFIEQTAGCIEHGIMVQSAIKYARDHKKPLCISWLDLANAFGSVSHNLVQFCFQWFHVPHSIAKLVFRYYDSVFAFVEGTNWNSN